jgi:hypothetical protein
MSTIAQQPAHIHYTALEDLLQELQASVSPRRGRKPRVRVQPLQVRLGAAIQVWGILVTVALGEIHSAWAVADQAQAHMLTPWREGTATLRQRRLKTLLDEYLAAQGVVVRPGFYAVPASAFTHAATLPEELVARLEEGGPVA